MVCNHLVELTTITLDTDRLTHTHVANVPLYKFIHIGLFLYDQSNQIQVRALYRLHVD